MLPPIRGVIDRRILVNYRVDPAVLDDALPGEFAPRTVDGWGIGGTCCIRLRDVRPRGVPARLGASSENAAHRIAVEVPGDDGPEPGVYVPRRDTDSALNRCLGGRVFPGVHNAATFEVHEAGDRYELRMESADGECRIEVAGERADALPADSVFDSVGAASSFLRDGSVGYSPAGRGEGYEALEVRPFEWNVAALSVDEASASYFESFPDHAVSFDHALLVWDVEHEWHEGESLCATPAD